LIFLSALLAILVCGTLAIFVAHHLPSLRNVRPSDLAADPRVLLPAQLASYLMVFSALRRYFGHYLAIGLLPALSWRFPRHAIRFLASGVLLGIAAQWSSQWLPTPPPLPIEQMVRTATDAWLMAAFGVLIAPFAEEVLFRGLLFPALIRPIGAPASLLVTSLLFGAVHAQQLAGAWIELACIVAVGCVLTFVRWRFRSLAASTLVHAGYNAALFATLFVQTRGFTHLTLR
jgi:hypothetical protein